ncbi:MAG: hypothetical protein HYU64_10050 [Armatimonadetes bacterium]|nr:hypothetical protein [Armatimonadota bacterium]
MTAKQLREHCEAEFENIESTLQELRGIVAQEKRYSTAELTAIAAFLHNFYNGIENTLKRIMTYQNVPIPVTSTWHRDLLKSASDAAIIPATLYEQLSLYLSFRHFFVHAYSIALRWEELEPLVSSIENAWVEFRRAVETHLL